MPDRSVVGNDRQILVTGLNFPSGSTLQLGPVSLPVKASTHRRLLATVPNTLEPGVYDLVVTTPDNFRGTLPAAFYVQNRDADNRPWQSFDRSDGLLNHPHTDIICDQDQVWVASVAGLSRYDYNTWTTLRDEVKGQAAYNLAVDSEHRLWVSGNDGLAVRTPADQWQQITVGHPNKRHSTERWGSIALTPTGDLWVTNRWGGGIAHYSQDTWARLTKRQHQLPSDTQHAILCDQQGTLWVAFSNGLYRLLSAKWHKIPLPSPLDKCSYISALALAPDGAVWAAASLPGSPTTCGILRFLNGNPSDIYTPDNSPIARGPISDMLITDEDELWVASYSGLYRLDRHNQWHHYNVLNSGLKCDVVTAIPQGSDGFFWCATQRGVSRFSVDSAEKNRADASCVR